jgi:hypothetical protein
LHTDKRKKERKNYMLEFWILPNWAVPIDGGTYSFLFLVDAGAAIDQGIAYFLLLLALAITYLFH